MELANWSPDKGINPFDYGMEDFKYSFEEFKIEYLTLEEYQQFKENLSAKFLDVGIYQEMRDIIFINSPQAAQLISPVYLSEYGNAGQYDYHEVLEKIDDSIDNTQTIQLIIDYPLNEIVKLTIFPLYRTFYNSNPFPSYPVGYICWQITMAYGKIFKEEYEKAGVWGHGLSDLQITSLDIYEHNKIMLGISS